MIIFLKTFIVGFAKSCLEKYKFASLDMAYGTRGQDSDQGFDDMFDAPTFLTTVYLTQPQLRPRRWAASTSAMRRHTSYDGQGMDFIGNGDGIHQFQQRRAPQGRRVQKSLQHRFLRSAPTKLQVYYPPKRASKHAVKKSQPTADRRQWSFSGSSSA